MNETLYLLDTNALTRLTSSRIQSEFFSAQCHVTSDVLFEAEGFREHDKERIRAATIEPSVEFFKLLEEVMRSEVPKDIRLVDLYRNKGTADPGLLATILEKIAGERGKFFPDRRVLVTDDHAVIAKATQFLIEHISPSQLASAIDSSIG